MRPVTNSTKPTSIPEAPTSRKAMGLVHKRIPTASKKRAAISKLSVKAALSSM